MAEQSVEEIRRLARDFLIGKGGPGDLADLKREMESDPQLPFELLQLMQTALDEVPPAGFSPDQWKEMDARVASMINPLLRSGFGKIGQIFSGLFKKRPKAEASPALPRLRPEAGFVAAAPPPPPPAPVLPGLAAVAQPMAAQAGEAEAMEEMAPIAAPESEPAPPPPEVWQPEAPLVPVVSGRKSTLWLRVGATAVGALVLFSAGYWGYSLLKWRKAGAREMPMAPASKLPGLTPQSAPVAPPAPPSKSQTGLPERSRPVAAVGGALPSELPPLTPQASQNLDAPGNLEAKDQAGNHGFPLP